MCQAGHGPAGYLQKISQNQGWIKITSRKGAKATEKFLCVLASLGEKLMNLTMKCDLTVIRKKMI